MKKYVLSVLFLFAVSGLAMASGLKKHPQHHPHHVVRHHAPHHAVHHPHHPAKHHPHPHH